MHRIYLDYAASTPIDKKVEAAMKPYFSKIFGNPSSLHSFGQEASRAVFLARQKIAAALGCDYKEIIFTGSATEANNLALRGVVKQVNLKPRVILSSIEHESINETCKYLERCGVEVVRIPVSKEGFVSLEKLQAALSENTILVSIIYANNEIGVIQDISKIFNLIKNFRKLRSPDCDLPTFYPLFHIDASQAFQYLPCKVNELGVDLMTLSAHKIYGPKGIGLLYARQTTKLVSIITGANQERGMRAGTENVPAIVSFSKAIEIAEKMRAKESARIFKLRNYFLEKLKANISKIELNNNLEVGLPNILNIYFSQIKAHDLLIALDIKGIAASAGSACQARLVESSSIILALGYDEKRAASSVRFSLGRATNKKDLDQTVKELKNILLAL